jgi:hypothetical protein
MLALVVEISWFMGGGLLSVSSSWLSCILIGFCIYLSEYVLEANQAE